jgi:hypothetical protein
MASLDDILTTQKNGVQAINAYVNALNLHAGTNNTKAIGGGVTQVIKTSAGWLATISVIAQGSTIGYIYDSNQSAGAISANAIYAIPTTLAIGTYQIQVPFATGLTIVTGTNSTVAIGYT